MKRTSRRATLGVMVWPLAMALPLTIVACGNLAANQTSVTTGPPGGKNDKTDVKPIAEMKAEHFRVYGLTELVRFRGSSKPLLNPPNVGDKPSRDGCRAIDPHGAGTQFLSITYACQWHELSREDETPLLWALTGKEIFRNDLSDATLSNSQLSGTVKITRLAPPKKTPVEITYARTVTFKKPAASSNSPSMVRPYTMIANSILGNPDAKPATGAVKTNLDANWLKGDNGQLSLDSTSQLTIAFLKPQTAKWITFTLVPKALVTFADGGDCPRPEGQFEWTMTDGTQTTQGDFTATQNGISEGADAQHTVIPWPTGSCAEFTPLPSFD